MLEPHRDHRSFRRMYKHIFHDITHAHSPTMDVVITLDFHLSAQGYLVIYRNLATKCILRTAETIYVNLSVITMFYSLKLWALHRKCFEQQRK